MKHLPIIITAVFFAVIAWWVWPKSTDAFVDFGREIYVAWRVSEGELPTRDFEYFNGPLSPLINGSIFKVFSPSVDTLKLANTVVAAGCTVLLFLLITRLTNQWIAMCGCMLFCLSSAFSSLGYEPYFSLLSPYSHEMSHGLLLLLGIFALLAWHRRMSALIQGLCVGLAALTKPEIFVACALAVAVAAALTKRRDVKSILLCLLGFILPIAFCLVFLIARSNLHTALSVIAGAWRYVGNAQVVNGDFYRSLRGMDHPGENLLLAGMWFAAWMTSVAICVVMSRMKSPRLAMAMAVIVPIAVFAALWNRVDFLSISRPLFVLLPLTGLWIWQKCKMQSREVLAICAACMVLTLKIMLDAKLSHYGFVLTAPGCVLCVAILAGPVAASIGLRKPVAFAAAGSLMLCLTVWLIPRNVDAMRFRLILLPVAKEDQFAVEPVRGLPLADVLNDLRATHDPRRTIAVVPAGAMVSFLLRERNPTGRLTLLPIDLLIFGENHVVEDFDRNPPDLIVLMHNDSSVHGARFFGQDYGVNLATWIREHYRPVKLYGATPFTSPAFGILVMARVR